MQLIEQDVVEGGIIANPELNAFVQYSYYIVSKKVAELSVQVIPYSCNKVGVE